MGNPSSLELVVTAFYVDRGPSMSHEGHYGNLWPVSYGEGIKKSDSVTQIAFISRPGNLPIGQMDKFAGFLCSNFENIDQEHLIMPLSN